MMYALVPDDVMEEIFVRLPPEAILKFRSVCKQWRSILESKAFVERRMKVKKKRKILAAYNCDCGTRLRLLPESRFEGDEEIVYLHCDTEKSLLTCDGLICIPESHWINIFNPSTSQLRRFRTTDGFDTKFGFGRDKVTGSFKVVRMCFHSPQCSILDVETGEWRKLSPPLANRVYLLKISSVSVNGFIYYWLLTGDRKSFRLLALDLHKEEFHQVVSFPPMGITFQTQIATLEDRLVIAKTMQVGTEFVLEILSMDADEQTWTKIYSISLTPIIPFCFSTWKWRCTPLALSKQGDLVFKDNNNRLFKYYPGTGEILCLSSDIRVMSLYSENLVPLPVNSTHTLTPRGRPPKECPLQASSISQLENSWISKLVPQLENFCIPFLILATYFCFYYFDL